MAWTAEQIFAGLRALYPAQEYVLLSQVRNSTGFVKVARYADALALNCWKSRGLELHGFEFKSRRSDWLAELKKPDKADPIFRYCDRWWLVVGDVEIVKKSELPKTWGLIAPKADKLKIYRKAEGLVDPAPLDRAFLAALLRRLEKESSTAQLEKVKAEGYEEGYKAGRQSAEASHKREVELRLSGHRQAEVLIQALQRGREGHPVYSASEAERIGTLSRAMESILVNGVERHLQYLDREMSTLIKAKDRLEKLHATRLSVTPLNHPKKESQS